MMKILWLASWYPNKREPFSGDFIQRQAEAVALFQPVKVIYVGKGSTSSIQKSGMHIENRTENLKEYLVYYDNNRSIFSKWNSLIRYFKKNLAILKQLRKNNELPDLIHVHVAMKAGLVALYLKWKYHIPYVLTEHWSGYYPQSKDSLFRKPLFERFFTKLILKNATRLLPVSHALGKQINEYWVKVPFQTIPNAVNTLFFYPAEERKHSPFRFIHISTFLYPKNAEGIIRVFSHMCHLGFNIELILVGPMNPSVSKLIMEEVNASGRILITGEIPYEEVGRELRNADALVMFSFYENMPCVILEALCSGIPVIATRVGGIPEVVNPENGILIEAGREPELLEAMKEMITNYDHFENNLNSHRAAGMFSYDSIGKQIVRVYEEVLANK